MTALWRPSPPPGRPLRATHDSNDAKRANVWGYTSFELMGEFAALVIVATLSALGAVDDPTELPGARARER